MLQGTIGKLQASTGVVKPGEQYDIMSFSYAKLFLSFFLTLKLAALEERSIRRMINAVDLHWKQEMFLSMLA